MPLFAKESLIPAPVSRVFAFHESPGALGPLGALLGGTFVRRKLKAMFDFRHQATREACGED